MASSLWKSFVEAVAPGCGESVQGEGVTHNRMVGGHPLSHCEAQSSHAQESSSKASLEYKGVMGDPNMVQINGTHNASMEGVTLVVIWSFRTPGRICLQGALQLQLLSRG